MSEPRQTIRHVSINKSQENGLNVIETHVDTDTSFLHQERLIEDCTSQKFRNVIVYSIDRLSRHLQNLEMLLKTFEDNDIKIFVSKKEEVPPMSSFHLGMLKVMADFENEVREERELIHSAIDQFLPA